MPIVKNDTTNRITFSAGDIDKSDTRNRITFDGYNIAKSDADNEITFGEVAVGTVTGTLRASGVSDIWLLDTPERTYIVSANTSGDTLSADTTATATVNAKTFVEQLAEEISAELTSAGAVVQGLSLLVAEGSLRSALLISQANLVQRSVAITNVVLGGRIATLGASIIPAFNGLVRFASFAQSALGPVQAIFAFNTVWDLFTGLVVELPSNDVLGGLAAIKGASDALGLPFSWSLTFLSQSPLQPPEFTFTIGGDARIISSLVTDRGEYAGQALLLLTSGTAEALGRYITAGQTAVENALARLPQHGQTLTVVSTG